MKKYFILFLQLVAILIISACGSSSENPNPNTIQVYGVIVDSEGKALENTTLVVFFDNIEIARHLSTPIYQDGLTGCNRSISPSSQYIGANCHNLNFSIPRVAEFNQDGSNITLNLRNIQIGEIKTFRSIDGRFLAFKVFETHPVRSILLLQADDTVITPLPETPVITPTFSANPSITSNTEQINNADDSSFVTVSFFNDWIRPFAVSFVAGSIIAVAMYFALTKKKQMTPNNNKKGKEEFNNSGAFWISLSSGTISAVLGAIILKFLGL